jgi:hypothetical protein
MVLLEISLWVFILMIVERKHYFTLKIKIRKINILSTTSKQFYCVQDYSIGWPILEFLCSRDC